MVDIQQSQDVRKQKNVRDFRECSQQPRHEDRGEDGIVEDNVVLIANWEKTPIGGHRKENLRRQDDVRIWITRCKATGAGQEVQIDKTTELQEPESNGVIAKH